MQRGDLGGQCVDAGRDVARPIREVYSERSRFVDLV
jgi:hypothetical protein